nr:tyrosine-protein phosphatase non-receptor type 23 [Pogona vitticeps]
MGTEQEAAIPITWTEIFSGKAVTHEDIKYEQACILYNLGALHSMLGAMDKRVSEEGMKVSCTHFQCAAGAFTYLRDHFPHSYSVDMSHQILNLNINLMLGQAQECLLEKSMLDNRKSFLVARISAQVVDYYKEACRALENSETASLLGKIQKDWKKLVQMKIYYFAAVAHLHMGKQAEEQQKYGERVVYFQSALDKLNEAIKLAKGQPETVQEALRFTMDVIGGKYNSAKKDNDFIYHEAVPALDTLPSVKGAPLVKALPVNPTDPAVTGPDIFAKLVPMAAHEASSLYSEEKAKLLREVMAKIDAKNEVLEQFMDSLQLDPETVDNLDTYNHIPPVLMEKCAALSVRPETVKNLVQSMQVLSGVFTDVEASLQEIKDLLDENEAQEQKLREALAKPPPPASPPTPSSSSSALAEVAKEWAKYMEVHKKASFTNTELHKAMNLHISNLRLLSGPLEQVRAALPAPTLTEDDKQVMQNLKRILAKVQEMKDQRISLEQQLREMIQKDDITTSLVTTDRSEMKKLFEEQLKKYDQIKVYLEQNMAAQENILKALTEANVKYAAVRKILAEVEHKWNTTLQTLVASYEAYEDLMKKSQEGKDFYADLESKVAKLLEKSRAACQEAEAARQQLMANPALAQMPTGGVVVVSGPALPSPAPSPQPSLAMPGPALLPSSGLLPQQPPSSLGPGAAPLLPGPSEAPFLHHHQQPSASTDDLLSSSPESQHGGPKAAALPAGQGPSQHWAGAILRRSYPRAPAHTSPQHLPVSVSAPPRGYSMGQPPPSSGTVLTGHPSATLALRPPPLGPAPLGPSPFPPQVQGLRPATTTVDSIQAPISSCTAPRGVAPPVSQQHWVGSLPQGGFGSPQMGAPVPFPYAQTGGPPFMAPFPAAQPQQSFSAPRHLQPLPDRQARPQPVAGQPAAPQPYAPQFLAQAPQLVYQHPFPPPPVSGQQAGTSQGPARPSPPPASPGQLPGQLGPQRYPGPGPDQRPLEALPPPPSGALAFPTTVARGPNLPRAMLGPSGQPAPLHPSSHAALQPGALAQVPFSSVSQAAPAPFLHHHQQPSASTDDLLSSSPESQHGGPKAAVGQPLLQPTKADAKEGLKPKAVQLIENDPYEKPERLRRLLSELERFQEGVASLGKPGELDSLWKELQEAQEKDARQLSIAIARCYSMKNRHQDIMPYDKNRVVLQSGKDDYINASRIEDLSSYCPTIIATQAPLVGTASDFWLMIYEQKVSVVVMLVSEQEIEKQKVVWYLPTERGQPIVHGPLTLVLTSLKVTPTHTERMITLQFRDQSLKRTVIHLQFSSWPELGLPDSKGDLLRFIQEVHSHYLHQRPLHMPIVVHCSSGVGRSGAFCLLYAAMQEVEAGNSIPDLAHLVRKIRQQRKHMLQEKLHLKFCYESVLKHAKQVLQRHGVTAVSTGKPASSATQKAYVPQDPQDLVLGGDVPISSIQATIAKLSIRPPVGGGEPATNGQQPPEPPLGTATGHASVFPASVAQPALPDHAEPPPPISPPPPATEATGPSAAENSHPVEEGEEGKAVAEGAGRLPAVPGPEPSSVAAAAVAPSSSSSLELLASLTPEAFTLDSSLKGRPRMSKQSFLQPQNGEGLRGAPASDDPLSMLDPLWTLNKT